MRKVTHIVVHHNGVDGRTIDSIMRTHLGFGWSTIGYHYVIHEDGSLHTGRKEGSAGAHVAGLNKSTIGVCMIGNMDTHPPTKVQMNTLIAKLAALCVTHGLGAMNILGHSETKDLVPKRLATSKTCPGVFTDMNEIRRRVGRVLAASV